MTKHSITLGDGLMTLKAEWFRGDMLVILNDVVSQKHVISRILTHTFTEHGTGVFQDAVDIVDTAQHRKFEHYQLLSTVTSPRTYLIQVMCTVNAARRFYGLPPIVWAHVEDLRKVYLGGLEVTTDKSGFLYADTQIATHIVRPGGVRWSDICDSCKAEWGTTDFIIEALELANAMRVKAGLRELVWEVV